MEYGILNANRDEMKIDGRNKRTRDYAKAYNAWKKLYSVVICYLVEWHCKDVFTVLEPKQ